MVTSDEVDYDWPTVGPYWAFGVWAVTQAQTVVPHPVAGLAWVVTVPDDGTEDGPPPVTEFTRNALGHELGR